MKHQARPYEALGSARIIARTNKATVYEDVDGSVAKQYHTIDAIERVRQDERSLGQLWQVFANASDEDGWRYGVTKLLRIDLSSGTIWLERAPGQAVFTLPTGALVDAEYHVGIWLAVYHNRLFGEADEGPMFADTNVGNILVDPVGRVVTGLDPGSGWGRIGSRYQDVIRHIYSLVLVLLRRRRGSLSPVKSFLRGYGSVAKSRVTAWAYARALGRETRRRWLYYERSKPKQFAFAAGSILLAPLFALYVPRVLARAMNAGRGRGKEEALRAHEPMHRWPGPDPPASA